jgi:hypothetical protein
LILEGFLNSVRHLHIPYFATDEVSADAGHTIWYARDNHGAIIALSGLVKRPD